MNVACIIPARGGSKGIPNKNIYDFAGKPLIYWSIKQALASSMINCGVYVSSDSDEILDLSEQFGAHPIQRPDDLSTDFATSESALIHAQNEISKASEIDAIIFLQATSPLREHHDLDQGIQQFQKQGVDSLFSSTELEDFFIWTNHDNRLESLNYDYHNRKRRQDVQKQYVENGSFYIYKPKLMMGQKNRLCGKIGQYIMKPWTVYEIDSMEDLELCEFLFKKNKLDGGNE